MQKKVKKDKVYEEKKKKGLITGTHILCPEHKGILIREIKAHKSVINSLEKFKLTDCEGLITCSKDFNTIIFSFSLDVYGLIK